MVEYNMTITSADTEYSQELPRGTRYVTIQCRTSNDLRGSFVTGKVATPTAPYFTVKSGGALTLPLAPQSGPHTLYIASPDGSVVAEVVGSEQRSGE